MAKSNLVIVESPAKVKTIKKFLGTNYEVDASGGHVRDLPKSQMGIGPENDFEPKYITIRGKGELLASLRKEAKKAEAKKAKKKEEQERLENKKDSRIDDNSGIEEDEDTVTITASSMEELLQKIQEYTQKYMNDDVKTDDEKKVGQQFDYSV